MRISIQFVQDLDTRIWKITSCANVTIFLILEKENSIETDMYIIWTIMYDYKLASIPRIIGVMRSRLTDNTLMESRRISTLRTAITSKTVVTCARYISSTRGMYRGWKLCPFIDSRFNFEKANPFLSRGIPVSKFKFDICTLAIYLRKGQTACFPAMFGREEIARTRAIKQVKC